MTKVLVTGANGFIGQHLCSDLLEEGLHVRAAVRKFFHSDLNHKNIEYVLSPDLGPDADWKPLLKGITHVVHLAGRAHIHDKIAKRHPELFNTVNTEGTRKLVLDAVKEKIELFLFISSVGAIGERTYNSTRKGEIIFNEETFCKPVGPYGVSKLEAENLLQAISADTSLKIVILRPPLVYGPCVKANFHQLMRIINKRIPLPLGLAKNLKSLVYVKNLTDAIITCLTHDKAPGHIFMVSDSDTLSIRDLIRRLGKKLGKPAILLPAPITLLKIAATLLGKTMQVGKLTDPFVISSEKIMRELGWRPPYTVEEGLHETVQWFLNSG